MRPIFGSTCIGLFLLSVAGVAHADTAIPLPEPGVLELAGIGIVAAVVAKLLRRRR
jgi:hypothetical protein